jgi:hypothetical protein
MAIQKISLKRLKIDLTVKEKSKNAHKVPDYEGFFRGKSNADFYVVGWLKELSSDLDLTVSNVDEDFLNANKYNSKKYFDWKYSMNL